MFEPQPKPHRFEIPPLQWDPADPLAVEYALVSQFIEDTLKTNWNYYSELNLDATEAGRKMVESDALMGARLVSVLVAYVTHFDTLGKHARSLGKNAIERMNWHIYAPEWKAIWPPRLACTQTLRRILRRKLPLSSEHLIKLAEWIASAEQQSDHLYPLKSFVKAVESYGKIDPGDAVLGAAISRVAKLFRNSYAKELPKLAHQLETILATPSESTSNPVAETERAQESAESDSSQPAPVGCPQVLIQLKQFLGILPEDNPAGMLVIGFDHFPLRPDSPLRAEHELISQLLTELVEQPGHHNLSLELKPTGRIMLEKDAKGRGQLLLALAERCVNTHFVPGGGLGDHRCWQAQAAVNAVFVKLLKTGFYLNRANFYDSLLFLSALSGYQWTTLAAFTLKMVPHAETMAAKTPLNLGERHVLHRLRNQFIRTCPFGHVPPDIEPIQKLLADGFFMALVPGEAWSDTVNAEMRRLSPPARQNWLALLQHASTATSARPSAKWLKTAQEYLKQVGTGLFAKALQQWFPLVNAPRTIRLLGGAFMERSGGNHSIHDDNATCLRGLLWMSPLVVSPDLIRLIGDVTVSCYRKIPGVGPRAVKAGNAGVYALSQIEDQLAVGQLALLKVKVKFGSAQKEIEKAFNASAQRSGLPREELEEMAVPTYGMNEVGICEEPMGEFTGRLAVTGTTSTELVWVKADGKIQRAVPAKVKELHQADLKELQASAKDIQKMLPAQRERIDGLFLQSKTWPLPVWRERYLNHPLIGCLARRILWDLKNGARTTTVIWFNGRLVDVDLQPVQPTDENMSVQLWHPIGKSIEEIIAWRAWLDAQQIQQPFKQAHREIYLLTEAERNTGTYSNRYAAHVVKQHQFNALCALRGWKNKLRLLVDAEYPPATLLLPQWGLRAEFWIEGLGADYGTDTNDSGVYHHLSTDQVRFYRLDTAQRTAHAGGGGYHPGRNIPDESLPLDTIPPLVFSEVMRDVDMFVGVASVGNDPTWSDGGPQGRYRDYWQNYSFGELNGSANIRKEVLARLVPKLKIASQCSFVERFLIVKGTLRTYKIHLGSGNILMEPNDQYLCIVPRPGEHEESGVLLPFEGDRTLSIILSKAFLLANDVKITDTSITRQIQLDKK